MSSILTSPGNKKHNAAGSSKSSRRSSPAGGQAAGLRLGNTVYSALPYETGTVLIYCYCIYIYFNLDLFVLYDCIYYIFNPHSIATKRHK